MFELISVLVVLILVLALIGFIACLKWMFGSRTQTPSARETIASAEPPTVEADLAAANRLLKYLHSIEELDSQEFSRIKKTLKQASANVNANSSAAPVASAVDDTVAAEVDSSVSETIPTIPAAVPVPVPASASASASVPIATATLVTAENVSRDAGAELTIKPAPWELPDPPEPQPRRTFAQLMAGFMEEKNMRWGELTSGILIVLSAVGLVVSLREQLSNSIPYFSSLLFLLLTTAIHAAAVYTLRKWKLRNTSRGALVIVLLLIPLNFVAACVLSGGSADELRRPLSDPWLWVAATIGIGAFSALAWQASQFLFRRGSWPLVVALIGCGIGTLLLSRVIETTSASVWYLVYSLPVLVSFLLGTCLFDPRQWQRKRWSPGAANRLYLFLGITTFAAIAAGSMAIVRGESKLFAAVALTPVASIMCIVISWLGSIVKSCSRENVNQRLTGLSLEVLGWVLLGMSLVASVSNPITFFVNSTISGVGLLAMWLHQKKEKRIGIAWGVLSLSLLSGLNLATGKFSIDVWTSVEQIKTAILNGKSGLCLLASGVAVVAFHAATRKRFGDADRQKSFMLAGWIAGAALLLAGCAVALIASLVNRENVFDVMTASGLLAAAAVGSLVAAIVAGKRKLPVVGLAHVCGVLLLLSLAHALLWNPSVANFVAGFNRGNNVLNWVGVAALHGVVMAMAAVWGSRLRSAGVDQADVEKAKKSSLAFAAWAAASTLAGSVGLLTLVPLQTGWATAIAIIASISWYLIGWSLHRTNGVKTRSVASSISSSIASSISSPFVLSTGVVVCVGLAELGTRFEVVPRLSSPNHWLLQSIGLAIWASVWTIGMTILNTRLAVMKMNHLAWLRQNKYRVELWVLSGIAVAVLGLLAMRLFSGSIQELSRNVDGLGGVDSLGMAWAYASLVALAVGFLVSSLEKPTVLKGAALIMFWLFAWAVGSDLFADSKSVASGIRWLLPLGGVVGAILLAGRRRLLPAWIVLRKRLRLTGPSRWSQPSTQALINFGLAVVAGVVILISTLTVSQVLLNGVDSLGGPTDVSWFKQIAAEISFGVPVLIVVATFLMLAISERRSVLATLGSTVFQYIVVLAVVLLFVSPHPKLASSWFVNILQAVSLGMTAYGFVWWWTRDRIEPIEPIAPIAAAVAAAAVAVPESPKSRWFTQLEIHTLINGLLVSSLAILVTGRFYFFPGQPGGWISSVGNWLGVSAWGLLTLVVWRTEKRQSSSTLAVNDWVGLLGWMGVVLVALLAAIVDRNFSGSSFLPWRSFQVIAGGAVLVGMLQVALLTYLKRADWRRESPAFASPKNAWPIVIVLAIGLAFAIRGALSDPASFWLYFALIGVSAATVLALGWLRRAGSFGFAAAAVAVAGTTVLRVRDPHNWFTEAQPYWLNLNTMTVGATAILWLGFYLRLRKSRREPFEPIARSFVALPNVVALLGSVWVFAAAVLQVVTEVGLFRGVSFLVNPLGVGAWATMLGLAIVMVWNDRARFKLVCRCCLSLAAMVMTISFLMPYWIGASASPAVWWVAFALGASIVVLVWSIVWFNRKKLNSLGRSFGQTRLAAFERSVGRQLPVLSMIVASVFLLIGLMLIFNVESRALRYLAAAVPLVLAVSFGLQSDSSSRRWLQKLSLSLGTVGFIFFAWADLSPEEIGAPPLVQLLVRTLVALAGLMFVYGSLVTRWVRAGDTWLKSLREMAVWTCGLAIVCFVFVLASEAAAFSRQGETGIGLAESSAVSVLVLGMIVGLITIAIRPENDPFALSLQGRMGYVYAAEAVAAGLAGHVYLSMPWLFRFGILEYWPYIMMAICFGAVGVARVLERRNLVVLGRPLFRTAAVIPLFVAGGILAISSSADVALVMLTVGMAYLLIGIVRQSVLGGAGATLFGTIALWLFLESRLSFVDHPQLWLIPPAVAVLVASQLVRKSLDSKQLATIRYLCVAIIYVSSTSEIFINGVGEKLWPPIVLALLSVMGVMIGIMFQVKSYLYLGSLFLLLSMITMVAHAHQRLEHVWPWWAFGIGLGVAILVMFGLFEKRKNEMNALAGRLKEWEA